MFKLLLCFTMAIYMVQGEPDYIRAPPEEMARVLGISLNCVDETGVDADTLTKLLSWTFKNNPRIRKFLYCLVTKAGYANQDGYYIKENLIPFVKNHRRMDEFVGVVDECNKLDGKDKYDRLLKISTCFHDKTPILFSI